MPKADLHLHTRVSDGMFTIEQLLEYVEHETDLDVIAVTDHEDVKGGLRAQELAAKKGYRFEVIAGAEITTIQGHLLALFIRGTPKSFKRIESTLEAIHRQDGLAIIPHPMSWLTRSLSKRTIDRIHALANPAGEGGEDRTLRFDGIETHNPSPAGRVTGARATLLNSRNWHIAETGGSDGHHLPHVGTGWTEFDGEGAAGLRQALLAGTTRPGMTRYPSLKSVGFGRAALGLAWGYAATPRKVLRLGKRAGEQGQ